jgi:putative nucleotidyltransferase with HDIG domain
MESGGCLVCSGAKATVNIQSGYQRILFHSFYALSLAAGGAMAWHLVQHHHLGGSNWPIVAIFFLFLLIADTKLSVSQVGGGKVVSSKSIVLSAIALFGPTVAVIMATLTALARGFIFHKTEARKALFNVAMVSVAYGSAGLAYHAMPWHDRFDGPYFLPALLVAILVNSIVNLIMLAAIMSLDARVPMQQVYTRHFSWVKLRALMDAPFSAMVILLYQQAGVWTLLLYLFPVLVLHQSDKLFQRMKEAHINSIAALTTALEADEPYTHGHSYRVSKYAVKIGRALGMSEKELEILEYGGLLHDIGKIAITNEIICKPGRLTEQEFETVKSHSSIGADIVEQIRFLRDASDLVRHHHERPDGRGYPHGLKDGQISLGCHILNVCDAFDPMSSDRPYRPALSLEQTIEELVKNRGTQFEERVVDTVLKLYQKGDFNVIDVTEGLRLGIQQKVSN